jgi:YidC/Oxa1 family membrane protein insertase
LVSFRYIKRERKKNWRKFILSKILGYPLGFIMYGIYKLVKDYGLALIIFTVLVKLLLFPIAYKQQKSMIKQQALAPKLEKLKKSYANNPQKYQEEQMKLYSDAGINPMASCLPLLIQLPILYGILDVVYRPLTHILRLSKSTINEATEILSNYFTANDITVPSSFNSRPELSILTYLRTNPELFSQELVDKVGSFNNTLLGFIDLGQTPTIHPDVWNASSVCLLMIPILSGLFQLILTIYTQYKQRQRNPETAQAMGSMNTMLYIMPLFSIWIAYSFPAGVGFYWAISSLFSLAQTIFLNNYFNEERSAKILAKESAKVKEKRKNNKQSFMDKMVEQQKVMNGSNDGNSNSKPYQTYDQREKLSRSEQNELNKKIINEARKRMAEKYGDEYKED